MVTEIELKYSLFEDEQSICVDKIKDSVSQLLSKHSLSFRHQEKQLCNAYFDTDTLALRKSRIALRTRGTRSQGETEKFEQTIKTSGTVIAGLHQRPEYNVDIDSTQPTLSLFPDLIWQKNTDIEQLQQQIIELFSTDFTRHTWLVDINHATVEVAFDCGEISCDGSAEQPRIFEIELELVNGETEALFVLTKLLFSQLALRPGHLTKAARGYALYHDSVKGKSHKATDEQPISPISLSNCITLNGDLSKSVEYALKHLQLGIDNYVEATTAFDKEQRLQFVCDYLELLQQVIHYFDEVVSFAESAIIKDLNKVATMLIKLKENNVDNEIEILAVLHGELFNNTQLALLSSLLKRNNDDKK